MSGASGITADWLGVDWGTTHLRLWALDAGGAVLAARRSDSGMARLQGPGDFEAALLDLGGDLLAPDRATPVIVCGMAGSRQGWAEAPYVAAPCAPPTLASAVRAPAEDPRLDVRLLPGVKRQGPADVMRGEETQVAGFLAREPKFDGVLCMPGTHSKWVHISAGEIVSFQTFLTGELFALLSRRSVLRHAVAESGWEAEAFTAALDEAMSRPAAIGAQLFALRAEALLEGLAPQAARARLSGLLIGLELAAARPYWLGQQVAVLGAETPGEAYVTALSAQAVPTRRVDAGELALEGLRAARASASAATGAGTK